MSTLNIDGGKPPEYVLKRGSRHVAKVLRKNSVKSANNADFHQKSFRQLLLHNLINYQDSHSGSMSRTTCKLLALEAPEQFRIDFFQLEMIKRIGSGVFEVIYKCQWRGIPVA